MLLLHPALHFFLLVPIWNGEVYSSITFFNLFVKNGGEKIKYVLI